MLDEIKALRAVAEAGSVQKASERLHLTQSAVSRQIQRLEESLGTVVLDRRNKPPTLTPAGLLVLERGRQILAAVDDLRLAAAKDSEPEGPLRIGIAHSLTESGIAEPLCRLARSFPRLSLTLIGEPHARPRAIPCHGRRENARAIPD
jgi:DNA-binding transcriptional LysR family regulator